MHNLNNYFIKIWKGIKWLFKLFIWLLFGSTILQDKALDEAEKSLEKNQRKKNNTKI